MKLFVLCAVMFPVCLLSTAAHVQSAKTPDKMPDYSDSANWVCKPGSETICTSNLDAMIVSADGNKVTEPFKPAADPAIDCFFVYPTISREQTDYTDMADSPEIQKVVNAQVGRLASRCRLFAPIYRQLTFAKLRRDLGKIEDSAWELPERDVEAAWDYYLQHDNHGHGVVLIGHSQGTILLQALMARRIDGTPAQTQLVSAFLAGDPSLGVPPGADVGGTFKHIPVCRAAAQTGCAYAWGTYRAEDATQQMSFGRARTDGLVSACSNPAAPAGGSAALKFYHPKRATAPASDPSWVESLGVLSGGCSVNPQGNGFRVSVGDVPSASLYRSTLEAAESRAGWGLHTLDLPLVQGNILDVLDAEIAAWKRPH